MQEIQVVIAGTLLIIILLYISTNKSRKDIKEIKEITKNIVNEYPETEFMYSKVKLNKTKDNVTIFVNFKNNQTGKDIYIDITRRTKEEIEAIKKIDKENIDIIIMRHVL